MQISELAETTGVPLPTVKFYLREGLLPKGTPVSATRSEYGNGHQDRIRLITALTAIPGLPIARMREILGVVDNWDDYGVVDAMGAAVAALPPYADHPPPAGTDLEFPLAREAIAALGLSYDPAYPATQQLDAAIRALTQAGLDWSPTVAARYRSALAPLAAEELAPISGMDDQQAVGYAVLGTALYEPIILAIRRLLHRDVAERTALSPPDPATGNTA